MANPIGRRARERGPQMGGRPGRYVGGREAARPRAPRADGRDELLAGMILGRYYFRLKPRSGAGSTPSDSLWAGPRLTDPVDPVILSFFDRMTG